MFTLYLIILSAKIIFAALETRITDTWDDDYDIEHMITTIPISSPWSDDGIFSVGAWRITPAPETITVPTSGEGANEIHHGPYNGAVRTISRDFYCSQTASVYVTYTVYKCYVDYAMIGSDYINLYLDDALQTWSSFTGHDDDDGSINNTELSTAADGCSSWRRFNVLSNDNGISLVPHHTLFNVKFDLFTTFIRKWWTIRSIRVHCVANPTYDPTTQPTDAPVPHPITYHPSFTTSEKLVSSITTQDDLILIGVYVICGLIIFCLCCGCCIFCHYFGCKLFRKRMPSINREEEMVKVVSDPINDARSDFDRQLVVKWLRNTVKLPQYIQLFIGHGYDRMDAIQLIEGAQDLRDLGIIHEAHQILILKEINKLKGVGNGRKESHGDSLFGSYRDRGEIGGRRKSKSKSKSEMMQTIEGLNDDAKQCAECGLFQDGELDEDDGQFYCYQCYVAWNDY